MLPNQGIILLTATFILLWLIVCSLIIVDRHFGINVLYGGFALVTTFHVMEFGRKYQKARCIYQTWKHPEKIRNNSERYASKRLYSFNYTLTMFSDFIFIYFSLD